MQHRLIAFCFASLLLLLWNDGGVDRTGALAFVAPVPKSLRHRGTQQKKNPRDSIFRFETTSRVQASRYPSTSVKSQRLSMGRRRDGTQLSVSLNENQESLLNEEEQDLEKYRHTDFVEHVESVESIEVAEFVAIGIWLAALSTFILLNEFVGPWPMNLMKAVPANIWLVMHYLGGMLFAGGIIMTTCIEWLVASTKDESVLKFWFGRVPVLDAFIVLPGLTMAMIAGTGVSIDHYGGLGKTPPHIETVFWTLVVFALWWALTDLTTQSKAAMAIEEWAATATKEEEEDAGEMEKKKEIPGIVHFRKISNVVSCLFIVALYGIMTLKPGLASY